MSNVQPILLQDEDGTTYTMFVESRVPDVLPPDLPPPGEVDDDERESMDITEDTVAKLKEIHGTIRAYAWYAIGAFKNFGGAEIEEMNLKFGLKIGGKTGVGKLQDESSRNRDISELEVMDQQSQGMLEHLNRFGIAQCFTMETS